MLHTKTVIAICGPTASGKTGLAMKLASQHHTSIISADSRQCFRELNIGVAKPSPAQLREVKHYFVNSYSIFDEVNAATFATDALTASKEIFSANDVAILAGGTGLYVKAFLQGMDDIPTPGEAIVADINESFREYGFSWLRDELANADSLFGSAGDMLNPQRMMRALAVIRATGRSILSYHTSQAVERPFDVRKIFLNPPRDLLYKTINTRVDEMMAAGLETEARQLFPYRELNALQTVGYRELFAYFDGSCSLDEAVALIKRNTRHYAKRQLTWFRKFFVDEKTEVRSGL